MSEGFVFHPGHDEWHGQTVVVSTSAGRTVIGRWDSVMGDTVRMVDVAVHEPEEDGLSRTAWVAKLAKYGIPVEHETFTFPHEEVTEIVRLRDA